MSSELISKYENKSISTRLKGAQLEYFLKYAKRRRANSISDTFHKMIDELMEYVDLSEDEVPTSLFDSHAYVANRLFLDEKGKKKLSLDEIVKASDNIEVVLVGEPPKTEVEKREDEEVEQLQEAWEERESREVAPEKKDDNDDNDDEEVITI